MRDGTQQCTMQESGTIEVRDTQITFRSESATITHSDSSVPAENYRSSTTGRPRTLTWAVSGNQLTLTENGQPTTYRRG
jgi:hypothetical protein